MKDIQKDLIHLAPPNYRLVEGHQQKADFPIFFLSRHRLKIALSYNASEFHWCAGCTASSNSSWDRTCCSFQNRLFPFTESCWNLFSHFFPFGLLAGISSTSPTSIIGTIAAHINGCVSVLKISSKHSRLFCAAPVLDFRIHHRSYYWRSTHFDFYFDGISFT